MTDIMNSSSVFIFFNMKTYNLDFLCLKCKSENALKLEIAHSRNCNALFLFFF